MYGQIVLNSVNILEDAMMKKYSCTVRDLPASLTDTLGQGIQQVKFEIIHLMKSNLLWLILLRCECIGENEHGPP